MKRRGEFEQCLSRARSALEAGRRCLETPDAGSIDRCRAYFDAAVQPLTALRAEAERGAVPGAARLELAALRMDVGRTAAMLNSALALRTGLAEALAASCACGYTREGQPVAGRPGHGLNLEA